MHKDFIKEHTNFETKEYKDMFFGFVNGDSLCLVAFNEENNPIGFIKYNASDSNTTSNYYTINSGYVKPEYRNSGVYTKLYAALVAEAKANNMLYITSSIMANNHAMQKICVKQGRVLVSMTYYHDMNIDGKNKIVTNE